MPGKSKGKKKGKRKGKKGKKLKSKIPKPEGSLSLDDFVSPERKLKTPPTLYEEYNTLPCVDSFFGQFLIGVETDERFDEFQPSGNKTLNLMLQQQTNAPPASRSKTKTKTHRVAPTEGKKSTDDGSENRSRTNAESTVAEEKGLGGLIGINDPLPTAWKQRFEASQRHPLEKQEIFACTECEVNEATLVCEECGQQVFCTSCSAYVHRARRDGLIGHIVISFQTITDIPYLENF
jgi:hypothetical protein